MTNVFPGPRLKIDRARHHVSELQQLLEGLATSNMFRLTARGNSIGVEIDKDFPPQVPLLIGDAIHNLRSALDIMICALVTLCGGTITTRTQFLFRPTLPELLKDADKDSLKGVDRAIIAFIVQNIKPYRGGHNSLYALHELDILDKHKLVIPVAVATGIAGVSAKGAGGGTMTDCILVVSGQGHGRFDMVGLGGTVRITNPGTPIIEVRFEAGQPFAGVGVIPILTKLVEDVIEVVDLIEGEYLKLKYPPAASAPRASLT